MRDGIRLGLRGCAAGNFCATRNQRRPKTSIALGPAATRAPTTTVRTREGRRRRLLEKPVNALREAAAVLLLGFAVICPVRAEGTTNPDPATEHARTAWPIAIDQLP